jgi:cell division protein FtsB
MSYLEPMNSPFYRKRPRSFDLRGMGRRLSKNRKLLVLLIVGLPVLAFVLFGNRGVVQRLKLQSRKAELLTRIRETEQEGRRLRADSLALGTDRRVIERKARENYRMVRQGETLYLVDTTKLRPE